jgi:transcriptional regulator NrdR family protein
MKQIVKRKGHKEEFDERKLYASIYAACMSLRSTNEEAELVADKVTKEIVEKIKDREEISSNELSRLAVGNLRNYNSDASYLYEHHMDVS